MEALTSRQLLSKIKNDKTFDKKTITNLQNDLDYLKQIKDIEKALGIDLITLFDILLENGVYIKRADYEDDEEYISQTQTLIWKKETHIYKYNNHSWKRK